MKIFKLLALAIFIWIFGCVSIESPQPMAKVIIEEFRDKDSGERISELIIVVDYEKSEDLIFEDYSKDEFKINVPLDERVLITINAPGYMEWQQGYRFNAAKFLMFPV